MIKTDMTNDRVVIVGGGVIGLCTACHALRKGLDVTVLERGPEGGDNCSAGNAGMIVPSHFIPLAAPGVVAQGLRWMFNPRSPFYIRMGLDPQLIRWCLLFLRHANARHVANSAELLRDLGLESRRLFVEMSGEEDVGLVRKGLLMLCRSHKALEEEAEVAEAAHRIGLQADVLDASQAAALDPGIRMEIAGAVHFPQDCHLDPLRFTRSVRNRVLSMGGRIIHNVEVDRFETSGGKAIAVSGGGQRFEGGRFVVCGGSWTARLLEKTGIRLPLQPGKGYSMTLEKPAKLPGICSILCEAKVAVTPMDGRLRVGGTMEVGSMDNQVKPLRVRGILDAVSTYFPEIRQEDFDGVPRWVGLRPVSPDGLPYLGAAPHLPNLFVSTGHGMMGLSLGPVSGKLMADLLTGDRPFRDIGGMAVGRF
jgi:D-amino-acid dehydrogenase